MRVYISTLSLHDALPIYTFDAVQIDPTAQSFNVNGQRGDYNLYLLDGDRKSTRLNSSHDQISYAVFCLKKKYGIVSHLSVDFGIMLGIQAYTLELSLIIS